MGMNFQSGKILPGSEPAYLYGSSLANTGAGPFSIDGPEPYPQWWGYVGADPVILSLPNGAIVTSGQTQAWIIAVFNRGTASASVQVDSYSTATIDTLAIGEAALYGWDEAALDWAIIGKWKVSGSSTFVNPMANDTALEGYETDGTTARRLAKIDTSEVAVLGNGAGAGTAVDTFTVGRLRVAGANNYTWSATGLAPVSDNARALGAIATRWAGLFNAGQLAGGFSVASASSGNFNAAITATTFAAHLTWTGGGATSFQLPAPASHTGRVILIKNASGSTNNIQAGVSGGSSIISAGGDLTPGDWRQYVCNGTNWYQVAQG